MSALARLSFRLAALSLPLLQGGCAALELGVMNAAGPVADSQRHLYLIVAAVLVFVAGPVLLLVPIIAWHYRLANKHSAYRPKWDFSWSLEGLIWIPPTAIVVGLGVVLWDYTHRLDPYRPIASTQPSVEIQAIALNWKWLFIYPDQRIAVLNQMAIPVGRSVHISLTSGTVMQSLMIPQLAGQIYAMTGMRTELNLAADRAGTFRGENVQFNGVGFQNQKFDVVSLAASDYEGWLAKVRDASHPLDDGAYRQLFENSTEPRPVFFSTVPDDLFGRILNRGQTASAEGSK